MIDSIECVEIFAFGSSASFPLAARFAVRSNAPSLFDAGLALLSAQREDGDLTSVMRIIVQSLSLSFASHLHSDLPRCAPLLSRWCCADLGHRHPNRDCSSATSVAVLGAGLVALPRVEHSATYTLFLLLFCSFHLLKVHHSKIVRHLRLQQRVDGTALRQRRHLLRPERLRGAAKWRIVQHAVVLCSCLLAVRGFRSAISLMLRQSSW